MDDKPLVNPLIATAPKFDWDVRFQQEVLGMLLNDRAVLTQTIGLIRPQYFTDRAHEVVCECLFEYFDRASMMPAEFVLAEMIRDRVPVGATRLRTMAELQVCLNAYVPGLADRDFNLDKITLFAKEQAIREAISTAVDLVRRRDDPGRWGKIEDVFRQALAVDRVYDLGLDYFGTIDERYARMRKDLECQEVFVTGFDALDGMMNHGGLKRGEIGAYMGLPGVGKSNFLIKAAKENLARNKKVLYVTLEMSEDKVASRVDSMLTSMAMSCIPNIDPGKMIPEHLGKEAEEIVKEYATNYTHGDKSPFRIKQFPAGVADMNTLRAYLSQLSLRNFKPDLVIVDYVGEMKDYPDMKTHESGQRLVRDLRGMAVEQRFCCFTAVQPNRTAREQQNLGEIDDNAIGDSFGQARPLDALWSINQKTEEKECGVGRLFGAKIRDGRSREVAFYRHDRTPSGEWLLGAECIKKEDHGRIMGKAQLDKANNVAVDTVQGRKYERPAPAASEPGEATHLVL